MFVQVGQRQTGHVRGPVTVRGRAEPRDPGQPLPIEPFQFAVALQLVVGQTDGPQTVKVGEYSGRQRGQVVVVQSSVNPTRK